MAETKKNKKSSTSKATGKKPSGKKSASSKKGKAEKKIPFSEKNYSAIMISYLLGGILIAFLCFVKGFNVWTVLRSAGFAFFGVGFYLLFLQCLSVGITMALRKMKRSVLLTNIFGFVFNVMLSSFVHLCTNRAENGGTQIWLEQLKGAMEKGWQIGQGEFAFTGGILGGFFGGGLLHALGKFGAFASVIILMLVSFFVFLNISTEALGDFLSSNMIKGKEKMDENAEEMKEKRIIRQQERAKRLEEEKLLKQQRAEEEKLLAEKQQEEEKRRSMEKAFDFASTNIEGDKPAFVDRKTGMPLRQIKRFYPGDSIFSYSDEGADIKADRDAAAGDFDFISEGEAGKRPFRPKASVGDVSAISEGAVPVRNKPSPKKDITPVEEISDGNAEIAEKAADTAKVTDKKRIKESAAYTREDKPEKAYMLPPMECLNPPSLKNGMNDATEMQTTAKKLVGILESFGVQTTLVGISRGPSVTRYELSPAPGVKINKITTLSDDIALGLATSGVRILAPIPDKAAVGIEVPNKSKAMVTLREIISSSEYVKQREKLLTVALGVDVTGGVNFTDLSKMPHLLIAGTTGSGKSVCLNCMITSILYNARPDQVKLIMIDPKQVEFSVYNGIPHLLVPVITDARKAAGSLAWAVSEMDNRYKTFSTFGVRDIGSYNKFIKDKPEMEYMPQIVVFIDELNDLMMVSPKEVEDSICRLAQKARAAGIHLVVATQRPSVDVITGTIKSNIPSRLSLAVSSQVDSKIILDTSGAENLLGNGDMLFSPVGSSKPLRLQGAYLSDEEIERIVTFIKEQKAVEYNSDIMDEIEKNALAETPKKGSAAEEEKPSKFDAYLDDAIDLITTLNYASTTIIQRKLSVGFSRAGRIMDQLEQLGYISPADGNKPRNVLISRAQYLEMKAAGESREEGEEILEQTADDYDIFSD